MKKIYVGKEQYANVDDEDYEAVSVRKWHLNKDGYAVSYNKTTNQSDIMMHRFIMNIPKGMSTDHINHDRLDNRKANLRACTRGENVRNNVGFGESGFKGVYQYKGHNKWCARIHHKGKSTFLGNYSTPEQAALAYNVAALDTFGEFAYVNKLKEYA